MSVHFRNCGDILIWLGPGLEFLQHTWGWNSATAEDEPVSHQELAVFTLKFNRMPRFFSLGWMEACRPATDTSLWICFENG